VRFRRAAHRVSRQEEFWDVDAAQRYDTPGTGMFAPRFWGQPWTLASLAGDGPVLEFAIGTGRVAVPLAERARVQDWLRDHGRDCVGRHRAWGSLPSHLVEQIDAYVVAPSPVRCLAHADLTVDQIFVAWDRLVGIIDWGDGMVTDPYTNSVRSISTRSAATRPCFGRFWMAMAGWTVGEDFARRAMSAALMHQFDLFAALPERLHPDQFDTLDALPTALWEA
jgi:hypothetical protein